MTTHPSSQPDDSLARLLAATAADAAPPDCAALAALREKSAAAFAEAGKEPVLTHQQRSTLFVVRAIIALAATAAVVTAAFILGPAQAPPTVAELTLGEVLTKLASQQSYRAELISDGRTVEVLGRGSALRIEQSPTRYTIASGPSAWQVDEVENRAAHQASAYYSAAFQRTDPLRLIGIWGEKLANHGPTGKRIADGREQYVFTASYAAEATYELEALVDAQTHLPTSLHAIERSSDLDRDLGRLRFIAFDEPIADDKLRVSATLTDDGRLGKITDWQGIVSLRPKTQTRWTPVCDQPLLRPGDWLRTDARGANAVTVQLAPQTKLILGPNSLVELVKPDQIVLHSGTAEITPSPKTDHFSGTVNLIAPPSPLSPRGRGVGGDGAAALDITTPTLVTATDHGLLTTDKAPIWLAGYKGQAVQESLGSLLANIDGRDVPLTVGYHRVTVEIRDQIARTTIEESFVNHTDQQLEGQFHFPLPADASISGFGMWIGDKLVEADIVEKQRAREIYETILREKRDPGLLEWAGGNIFKARVYPIFPRSEKRIKITYTQVLPRTGASYRYSYALQSELLRQNPLRQLDLDVTVHSTQPLAGIHSPTHPTRNQLAKHAARVEFSAQQHRPERDFEVVVETAGNSPDLTFIPHQRGDDGYFALFLQPPAEGGQWQRDLLPDGEPLDLIVLADTSASMDARSRKVQAEVLASLLAALGPTDQFQLAACDVDCGWSADEARPADEKQVAAAREFLAKRRSLGWTDLDKAFSAAVKRAKAGTQIVYLGDGIVTSGQADGVAFSQRLSRMAGGKGVTLHAIAVSSSYDAPVLRGIASIGGGSLRQVSGEIGPQQTAKDLLAEITRPALRDIRLEFQGLRTARVYPRTLPNIPAGTQQIVLGRYLPQEVEQQGEVIVSGTLEGKLVTYRKALRVPSTQYSVRSTNPNSRTAVPQSVTANPQSAIRNPQSAADSSFIPRLWARMHLDELLAQGSSQEIQDEIVALSEEFHIMTPYTSLLVLESDADRERFKVKKRFQMRDGERFFAQGADEAQYSLVQQQVRRAGTWRLGLRQSILQHLASLGRSQEQVEASHRLLELSDSTPSYHRSSLGKFDSRISWATNGGRGGDFDFDNHFGFTNLGDINDSIWFDPGQPSLPPSGLNAHGELPLSAEAHELKLLAADPSGWEMVDGTGSIDDFESNLSLVISQTQDVSVLGTTVQLPDFAFAPVLFSDGGEKLLAGIEALRADRSIRSNRGRSNINMLFAKGWDYESAESLARAEQDWFLSLLRIDSAIHEPKPRGPKLIWPVEAIELSRSLRSAVDLGKLEGGLIVEEQNDSLDAHRQRLTSRSRMRRLESAKAWLTRTETNDTEGTLDWCSAGERGVASLAYELAIVRKAAAGDLHTKYEPGDWWRRDLADSYQDYLVEVQRPADGQVLLILRHVIRPHEEIRFAIETEKRATLSIEWRDYGRPATGSIKASDLVEVAGVWLPRKVEHFDEQGRLTTVVTRKYQVVDDEQFNKRLGEEIAAKKDSLTIKAPLPRLEMAQKAVAGGKATLEDRLMLLIDFASRQQWPEANAQFAECEKLIPDKSFALWIRLWLLDASRRNEELRLLLLDQADALARQPRIGDLTLADRLLSTANSALDSNEQIALLGRLQPVFARQPEHVRGLLDFGQSRISELREAGRHDEQLAAERELASAWPDEAQPQIEYASHLAEGGDYEAAYAWLKQAIGHPQANWPPQERDRLYQAYADFLKEQGRYADLAAWIGQWSKLDPAESDTYELLLAALVYTNREPEAGELIAAWLRAGLAEPPLPLAVQARRDAAIETAIGDNSYLRGGDPFAAGDVETGWLDELAEVLLAYVERDDRASAVWKITQDSDFRGSEQLRAVGRKLSTRLKAQAADLPPGPLAHLVDWLASYSAYHSEVTEDDWKKIAAAIRTRWEAAEHPANRASLAQTLLQALGRISNAERLAFLRTQLERATDHDRAAHARTLFDALLEADWSEEIEAESLGLIEKLSAAEDPAQRLSEQVAALYRWTDRMEQARWQQASSRIEHPEKLTRTELAEKRSSLLKEARAAVAGRLEAAATRRTDGLGRWMQLERLTLEVKLHRDLPKVIEACWELLGPIPPVKAAAAGQQVEFSAEQHLRQVFRIRLITMLTGLATRRDAPAAEVARLEEYLDDLIARDPEGQATGIDARQARFALLVALDKPQALAEKLAVWSRTAEEPQVWQRALAYLQAELGQLEQAAALLQTLIQDDALSAADYRALAGWQQALGRRGEHDQALVLAYEQLDEYELRNIVRRHLAPWQRSEGPSPGAIDPELFIALKALFAKANDPHDHVYFVRQFYEASRDFRLLASLADASIGQSAQKVYPFLRELQSTLGEIDREATADELLAHVEEVRERTTTPVDRRALDLLEMLVARRAAEVIDQPGPHVERAVRALARAQKHAWSPGEPGQMAELLADLGRISQPALAEEVLRAADGLYQFTPEGSLERLQMAQAFARTLESNERAEAARDVLETAIAGYRRTSGGKTTMNAASPLAMLAGLYATAGQFLRAETVLTDELPRAANPSVASRLTEEIYGVHIRALADGGATSLGSGALLYRSVEAQLRAAAIETDDSRQRKALIERLCGLYRAARDRKLPTPPADLVRFAEQDLPPLLTKQVDDYQEIVERVATTIAELAGPREALAFVISRIEAEPRWLARGNDSGWQKFARKLGEWRDEAKTIGDLEPRLLAIVLAELRRDLRTRNSRARVMYHDGYTRFWTERRDDFARAAEEVLAERRDSQDRVLYVAEYLFEGLDLPDRAIAALLDLHQRKLLGDGGQSQLASYLERQTRFGEAALILEPLVERWPNSLDYRTRLMRAYFRTKRQEALVALLAATDKHFHAMERWNEDAAGQLAASCLENELFEQAVAYYKEAISRREEALPGRGIGDDRLANYYLQQARAYAGLKNTADAVEAAASAIVVYGAAGDGPRGQRRRKDSNQPLDVLFEVLKASPNLDAYVAELDKQTQASRQDRPIIRKALGEVFSARNEHDKALVQFQLALELAPSDSELHAELVACYDELMKPREAAEQLVASVELSPRNLDLWTSLAERLEKLEEPAEAERARTSLVEVDPTEAEGHAKLAEIRQEQQRWEDAILHWRHVARIRKLEPTGLLGLAEAQILAKDRDGAEATITELEKTDWPARFHDELREKLPTLRAAQQKLP